MKRRSTEPMAEWSGRESRPRRFGLLLMTAMIGSGAMGVAACSSPPPAVDPGPTSMMMPPTPPVVDAGPPPFEATQAYSYVAKVKNALVGQAPTADEVRAVIADPRALRDLIDKWMMQPEYTAKMMVFFRNAFQQGQIGLNDFTDQIPAGIRGANLFQQRLLRGFQESFARTVVQLVSEGRPFNEVVTTRRFMMTPPLMSMLAYLDNSHVDDKGGRIDRIQKANPKFAITLHNSGPAIPIEQTLDPTSANYMHWNNPITIPAAAQMQAGCMQDPRVYKSTINLESFLFGVLDSLGQTVCTPAIAGPGQFTDAEYDDWKMVTVRTPKQGEQPTLFFDLPTLRTTTELVLTVPRVGFFSTPAFFANWQTNVSNLARVTMNQTLIVSLGASFDDSNSIVPVAETALDKDHAAPGTACYGCHKTLDPMRQFFRQAFTLTYSQQADPMMATTPGVFAFGGMTAQGTDIYSLADMLAAHPRFPIAWAQKVCFWANSAACSEDDPEFARIAQLFQTSGFNWNALVKEMLASPLTTAAANTKTFDDRGVVVNVSRRDPLCAALSNRLGVPDICGQIIATKLMPLQIKLQGLSTGLPSDGYSRGSVAPVLSNDPSLFFRDSTENVCRAVADYVVDAGMTPRYSSMKPAEAITDFVHNLMAITDVDPRAAELQQVLTDHFTAAQKAGLKPTDALKSTFVLACESPTSVAIGL